MNFCVDQIDGAPLPCRGNEGKSELWLPSGFPVPVSRHPIFHLITYLLPYSRYHCPLVTAGYFRVFNDSNTSNTYNLFVPYSTKNIWTLLLGFGNELVRQLPL